MLKYLTESKLYQQYEAIIKAWWKKYRKVAIGLFVFFFLLNLIPSKRTNIDAPMSPMAASPISTKDYKIVKSENLRPGNVYWILVQKTYEKDELAEFIDRFRSLECQKACSLRIFDTMEAVNLQKEDDKLADPDAIKEWQSKNYVYLADHFVGSISYDEQSIKTRYYPYRDSFYAQLKLHQK